MIRGYWIGVKMSFEGNKVVSPSSHWINANACFQAYFIHPGN